MRKMSLRDWGAVAEIAGTVAVVISLLFVAVSVQRNTDALSGQYANEMYDVLQRVELVVMADTELMLITIRGRDDPDSLSELESQIFERYLGTYLEIWDRAHAREQEGLLQTEVVAYWHEFFNEFFNRSLTKEMWEKMRWAWPNPEFQARVDAALSDQHRDTE